MDDDYPHHERIADILSACRETASLLLAGISAGNRPSKFDIKCFLQIGQAIYLLRHKSETLSEDLIGYCALLGGGYMSAAQTVMNGHPPEGFSTVQSRASAQKLYVSSRRRINRKLAIYTSQLLFSATYAAYDDPRHELIETLRKAAEDIRTEKGLIKFTDAATFFIPGMLTKCQELQALLHTPPVDKAQIVDVACAIEALYQMTLKTA